MKWRLGWGLTEGFFAPGKKGRLAGLAEALEDFVVDGELAFLLQAVFQGGAESVKGCALLGLEELLLDLVFLFSQIFGEHGLMSDAFVDDPCTSELGGSADLAHGHIESGGQLMAGAEIGD